MSRTRFSACTQLTTPFVVLAFSFAAVGCHESPVADTDHGSMTLHALVYENPDGTGALTEVISETVGLRDVPIWEREILLGDGVATLDVSAIFEATEFSVPLTRGGVAKFVRENDVIALHADSLPSVTDLSDQARNVVRAVRIHGTELEFYAGPEDWRTRNPNVVLRIDGLTEGTPGFEEIVANLALSMMLGPLDDHEQIAWVAVIAIVGLAWLAFCSGALGRCAYECRCYSGYRLRCLGFTVSYVDGDWDVDFTGRPECTCVLPMIGNWES